MSGSAQAGACVTTLRLFAPAKINWLLTVRGQRSDGYHELDTVYQTLAWGDELRCRSLRRRICHIQCNQADVPTDESNLIARAWRLMAGTFQDRVGGLAVELIKRIPMGAGLGGGSSDGAAALVALDRLYGLRLSPGRLEQLAARLGSDCAFFIRGGVAVGSGRGERLRLIRSRLSDVWLVVVWPGFPSSTARAYEQLEPRHWERTDCVTRPVRAIERGRLPDLQRQMKNIFSEVVMSGNVRYHSIHHDLIKEELDRPFLAGSGSAMFGFAHDRGHARRACGRLGLRWPLAVSAGLRCVGVRVMPPTKSTPNKP